MENLKKIPSEAANLLPKYVEVPIGGTKQKFLSLLLNFNRLIWKPCPQCLY